MSWWEILLIIAACAFVVGVIAASVIRRKQGKTGCGCDCGGCSGCSGCSACASEKKEAPHDEKQKQPTRQSP